MNMNSCSQLAGACTLSVSLSLHLQSSPHPLCQGSSPQVINGAVLSVGTRYNGQAGKEGKRGQLQHSCDPWLLPL